VTGVGTYVARRPPLLHRLSYRLRVVRVLARTEFKLKYVGSILGYFWSLAKPLLYFTVLWLVFDRLFSSGIPRYPLYLLIGIVLYTFVADAVALALPSIVNRAGVVRRMAFPSIVIPVATTVSSALTFLLNALAVAAFVAISRILPEPAWLLLIPLALELYVFTLGIALIFASLYVRFRDMGQFWEVLATVFLFTSPTFYPIGILPELGQKIVSLNPLVQVMQDARRLILGGETEIDRFIPLLQPRAYAIAVALGTLGVGIWLHWRESPRFAEVV
jgi:ABC-2 type transport system permease protein